MNKKLYKNKQWLQENYKTKTTREIAKECNTNHQMILRWLDKFNIQRRTGKEARLGKVIKNPNVDYNKKYRNKDWLESEYKTKTVQQIATENNISKSALLKWFKKFGIQRKTNGESHSLLNNVYYFDKINSAIKAYWLGFLMADGANTNESIAMNLSIKDIEHMKTFKNDIKWNGKIHTGFSICKLSKYDNEHEHCYISIHSKYMSHKIKKYGICENKTGKESFPFNIPKKYYKDFIRGYFDGDGCYTYFYRLNKNKYKTLNSSIKIVCANKNFLEEIKKVLIEDACINSNKIHIYNSASIYSLEISSNKPKLQFYNYIYPKYCRRYLKRKKDIFDETIDYMKSHIK